MEKFNSAMDVFKLLEKTNCRKCNKPTCLAFAAAVFQGRSPLEECPHIDEETLKTYGGGNNRRESRLEQGYDEAMKQLKAKIRQTDIEARAHLLGAEFSKGRLTLKILGKDFSVDANGEISTDIHVNPWIAPPVMRYILSGKGLTPTQTWVPFRELETAGDWARFFEHQCIRSLKQVADASPTFFEDIIELFNGRPVKNHYEADIALVIHPLPLLPMLICYNYPEDGLESDLNLFFDNTADKNLPVENIYTLATGLANMLKKLADTHGGHIAFHS
ncbi:MAG: DUF3786 domain-containing protein [Desulfobacter sp.]|nr:MAG: DUF3786 domain-containing protein [Desulfobacter sp.]